MTPVNLIVGAAMLLFGRRLFWVFVAGVGFVSGALLTAQFLTGYENWVLLAVAAGAGVLGAILALFAQKVAIGVAGALGGGYLAHELAVRFLNDSVLWIAVGVGCILGAILLIVLFDWALIIMSSLIGAAVISQQPFVTQPWQPIVFIGLFVLGIVIQSRQVRPKPAAPPRIES